MKALMIALSIRLSLFIALILIGFTASAQAAFQAPMVAPMVVCQNDAIQAHIIEMPSEKDVQLLVQNVNVPSPQNLVYHDVLRTMSQQDTLLFLNATASLRVVPTGQMLKGFLNLRTQEAGVGQVLDCVTMYQVMPVANEM